MATPVIDGVAVAAYEVPTETERESDGTLVWDSTSMVLVELRADDQIGLGYTYCHPAAARVIADKLAGALLEADPLMPQRSWAELKVNARQLGHGGLAAMAISAVDIALWDLKAKLLGVSLADLLPRFRRSVPVYGSGGFTSYSLDRLQQQLGNWAERGFASVKMKVGRDKAADAERLRAARDAIGGEVELMVDGNGAYAPKEALAWAERFASGFGVTYFEEPVTSEDLEGMRLVRERAPAGMAIAAGEYGWDLPDLYAMADAVDVLQADVSRCGGITNMLRVDGLCKARSKPFSAHCVPAVIAHVGCAMETFVHAEYFFDHVRIESMLFDGTLDPQGGRLTPDRSRPGLGLSLRRSEADQYELYRKEMP